jgi:hypothetical protein
MKKINSQHFLLSFLLLFQSCATTVVNHNSHSKLFERGLGKSITVRTTKRILWKDRKYASFQSNSDSEKALVDILKNSGFKEVKIVHSDFTNVEYKGDDYLVNYENKIKSDIQQSNTDYFLDIYEANNQFDPHHGTAFVALVYSLVHIVSLGLIPMIHQQTKTKVAELYYNNRLIKTSKAVGVTTYKTWSPFIFKKDAKRMYDQSFNVESEKIVINKVLMKSFKAD